MTGPFICVFLSFLFIILSKIPVSIAMHKQPGGYDNHNPRSQQANLSGWGKRALSAHQNSFESFPPFAAAVIIAHLAEADPYWSIVFSIIFVISRAFFWLFYLTDWAYLRTTSWFVGLLSIIGLFILPLLRLS